MSFAYVRTFFVFVAYVYVYHFYYYFVVIILIFLLSLFQLYTFLFIFRKLLITLMLCSFTLDSRELIIIGAGIFAFINS